MTVTATLTVTEDITDASTTFFDFFPMSRLWLVEKEGGGTPSKLKARKNHIGPLWAYFSLCACSREVGYWIGWASQLFFPPSWAIMLIVFCKLTAASSSQSFQAGSFIVTAACQSWSAARDGVKNLWFFATCQGGSRSQDLESGCRRWGTPGIAYKDWHAILFLLRDVCVSSLL
jgi:hypothetical protein